MKTAVSDVVTIQGSLLGGDVFSPESNSAIPDMAAAMLDQGSIYRDKFSISQSLEEVGASLFFAAGNYRARFSIGCLSKDVPRVVELLAEQMRYPAMKGVDLKSAKRRRIGELKNSNEDTHTRAFEAFLQEMYPPNHPNFFIPLDQQINDTEEVRVEDVKNFHGENYGKGSLVIVGVGDVDRQIMEKSVAKGFSDWKESPLSTDAVENVSAKEGKGEQTEVVTMKDKMSVDLVMGQPIGIDRNHEDFLSLMMGHFILGGNFSARLMSTVRDEEGLTYGTRSTIGGVANGNDGYWYIWGTFAPELINQGRESTLEKLRQWISEGVTEDELRAKKSALTGTYKVGLATTRGLAGEILATVERGKSLEYMDEYPDKINALKVGQVNNAIDRYCNEGRLVTVAAGSIDKKWKALN